MNDLLLNVLLFAFTYGIFEKVIGHLRSFIYLVVGIMLNSLIMIIFIPENSEFSLGTNYMCIFMVAFLLGYIIYNYTNI